MLSPADPVAGRSPYWQASHLFASVALGEGLLWLLDKGRISAVTGIEDKQSTAYDEQETGSYSQQGLDNL